MEFAWNQIQAEDIRQASVAAMQGTYEDMQAQAASFAQEAAQLAQEASALAAQPPIMRSETRTGTGTDSEGNSYSYTYTVQVVDAAAMAERAAQVAEMQARSAELTQAANALNQAASLLQEKIGTTNALFYKLQNLAKETDAAAAAKMEEIKRQIEAYIVKIGQVRDSFGNMFVSEADGHVYFKSSATSVLSTMNFDGDPTLMDEINEAKQMVARGKQPAAKQNEREVLT